MREKLYKLLFFNFFVKRLAIQLLNSARFVNNPLYQYFLERQIDSVARRYEKCPNIVMIENTNICNSRCSMCPHEVMKRGQGVMSEDLYRKIIGQCAEWGVDKIGLHGFGEPLIDKDFPERIKYAKDKGIAHVGTSSNGSLMSESLAEALILAGLDEINFSLDAVSQSAYEKMRVGLPYEKTMANVKRFIDLRNSLGRSKPFVIVDLIETDFNRGEATEFKKRWEGLADRVNITTLHAWGGSYNDKAGKGIFHTLLPKIKRDPCRFLWTDMVVTWDGRVSACCQDYESHLVMGDAKTTNLKDIWQGSALSQLRETHRFRKFGKVPLCGVCNYRSVWWLFR